MEARAGFPLRSSVHSVVSVDLEGKSSMSLSFVSSFVYLRVLRGYPGFLFNHKGHEVTRSIFVCGLMLCGLSVTGHAQARPLPGPDMQQIYQRLLPQIEKIPIFDHHAHPGFFDDPDVDAMAAPPGSAALRERDTNPELVAAARALFAYPYNDLSPEHAKWLVQKKAELKKAQCRAYFSTILDKLNIERSEEHTSELQSQSNLVCRLLLEKKKKTHANVHRSITPTT